MLQLSELHVWIIILENDEKLIMDFQLLCLLHELVSLDNVYTFH